MQTVLLVILLLITLLMIGVILLQRGSAGALGGNSSNDLKSFLTPRASKDILTRVTAILAALFMGLCLLITIIAKRNQNQDSLLMQMLQSEAVQQTEEDPSIDSSVAPTDAGASEADLSNTPVSQAPDAPVR